MTLLVVAASIFSAAALLFVVEPMAAKLVLPRLGGAPAVWNGCVLFFQIALLAGYFYAHVLSARLSLRAQVTLHAALLIVACVALPLGLPARLADPGARPPLVWLLSVLSLSIGLPFVILAATGPLVQRWFSSTSHPHAKDPYFLYAASNVGSLAGLLAYPFLLEPSLPLLTPGDSLTRLHFLPWSQSTLWALGYVAVVLLVIGGGIAMLRKPAEGPSAATAPEAPTAPTRFGRLRWLVLAAIPASLLLGATQYITTDVAPIPLFWVLPLAAYLLSFALAFSRRTLLPEPVWGIALAVLALGAAYSIGTSATPNLRSLIALHTLLVLAAGMVCHRRLRATAPTPSRLTEFYLCVAAGSVLGGAFNTIAAPVLFPGIVEYPLAILAACFARPPAGSNQKRAVVLDLVLPAALLALALLLPLLLVKPLPDGSRPIHMTEAVTPCLVALAFAARPRRFALALAALFVIAWVRFANYGTYVHRERTFFGVLSVIEEPGPTSIAPGPAGAAGLRVPLRSLFHGTTRHGSQLQSEALRRVPGTYYHRTGPIGQVFAAYGQTGLLDRVAVIGLGAGTLAAYGEPGHAMQYYEIDPAVVRIARDPSLFTFVNDSRAALTFTVGDGRLEIAKAPDGTFGLIVVDAFSSDVIPVHLLTREALAVYVRKLRPGGLVALHLTNGNLDLTAVVDALTADSGLASLVQGNGVDTQAEFLDGKKFSVWAVIATDRASLAPLAQDARWVPLPSRPGGTPDPRFVWTDDYSSIFTVATRW